MSYFSYALIFFFIANISYSVELEQNDSNTLPYPIIVLTAAIQGGSPGTEYNENYMGLTFGQFNTYENGTYLQAALKFTITEKYRLGGFVGYNSITAIDKIYDVDEQLRPIIDNELYDIDLEFKGIPIGAMFEYLPFTGQFRTFVGVGAGLEIGEYSWAHRDLVESDERKQNNSTVNRSLTSPFIRINAGTELGFDRKWRSGFFAGLSADISITKYFRSADMFSDIDPFFYQGYTDEEITFFPWQINFGVSLILNALD